MKMPHSRWFTRCDCLEHIDHFEIVFLLNLPAWTWGRNTGMYSSQQRQMQLLALALVLGIGEVCSSNNIPSSGVACSFSFAGWSNYMRTADGRTWRWNRWHMRGEAARRRFLLTCVRSTNYLQAVLESNRIAGAIRASTSLARTTPAHLQERTKGPVRPASVSLAHLALLSKVSDLTFDAANCPSNPCTIAYAYASQLIYSTFNF